MAITEPFTINGNSTMLWWGNSDSSGWNPKADTTVDEYAAKVEKSRAALTEFLRNVGDSIFKPLLLVFKRFDFRAAPRWRAKRWKAKT